MAFAIAKMRKKMILKSFFSENVFLCQLKKSNTFAAFFQIHFLY